MNEKCQRCLRTGVNLVSGPNKAPERGGLARRLPQRVIFPPKLGTIIRAGRLVNVRRSVRLARDLRKAAATTLSEQEIRGVERRPRRLDHHVDGAVAADVDLHGAGNRAYHSAIAGGIERGE